MASVELSGRGGTLYFLRLGYGARQSQTHTMRILRRSEPDGDGGAFRPLSVALTSYIDAQPGDLTVQLRKRGGGLTGPVLANLKKAVPVLPGRKQVIEIDFVGTTPFVSIEDEGPVH